MHDFILCKGSQTLRYEKTKDRKRPYPMCWDHAEDTAAASCWPRRCWWSDNTHLQHTEISPCSFYLPQPVRTETQTDRHIHSHIYTWTCIHTQARRETHTYIYTQTRAHPQAQEITHAHTHSGTHTHTHTHTHTRTHANTYTHHNYVKRMQSNLCSILITTKNSRSNEDTALCTGMHTVYIHSILWFKLYACKLALGKSSHCRRLKMKQLRTIQAAAKSVRKSPRTTAFILILLLDCGSKTQTLALNDTKELRL